MAKLVRHRPSRDIIHGLRRDINSLFDPFGWGENDLSGMPMADWHPRIDIKDDKDRFVIHADIPGVDPKEIEIHMDNGILTIKGTKESKTEEKNENYLHVERSKGSFMRSFSLPETVDADNIKANSNHGVLKISIPKSKKASTRKITVEE